MIVNSLLESKYDDRKNQSKENRDRAGAVAALYKCKVVWIAEFLDTISHLLDHGVVVEICVGQSSLAVCAEANTIREIALCQISEIRVTLWLLIQVTQELFVIKKTLTSFQVPAKLPAPGLHIAFPSLWNPQAACSSSPLEYRHFFSLDST